MGVKHGHFRLPWYAFAPEENMPIKINEQGAFQGTYFGPVHEIRDTRDSTGFVSIRVPMPFVKSPYPRLAACQLVWINVCKCKAGDSWQSCKRVSSAEVRRWERHGWRHKWLSAQTSTEGLPGGLRGFEQGDYAMSSGSTGPSQFGLSREQMEAIRGMGKRTDTTSVFALPIARRAGTLPNTEFGRNHDLT